METQGCAFCGAGIWDGDSGPWGCFVVQGSCSQIPRDLWQLLLVWAEPAHGEGSKGNAPHPRAALGVMPVILGVGALGCLVLGMVPKIPGNVVARALELP